MERPSKHRRILARALVALPALALLLFILHAGTGLGGPGLDELFNSWVYSGLILYAAAACLARALTRRREWAAWSLLGGGLLFWAAGEIYWTIELSGHESQPYPSTSDGLHVSFYLASYAGLLLLLRSRVKGLPRGQWLDGGIAALAAAALAAAVALGPIVERTHGDTATVATSLAYPIGDLVLLGLVVCAFGISGWRPGRAWIMLGGGLLLSAIVDGIYLFELTQDTYIEGGLLDTMWPAAALLVGAAAWQPDPPRERIELAGSRAILIPAACAAVALALVRSSGVAGGLALATLVLVTVRMALTYRENQTMLRTSRRESLTDPLTGIGNRRRLMLDLAEALRAATPTEPRLLVLFDLNGFKRYNDTFGHPAGDHLLMRLGQRLEQAALAHGTAYRLGGDEFCLLARPGSAGHEPLLAAAATALSERGDGFEVDSSLGQVMLPSEAQTVEDALRVADRRMYAQKGRGRAAASRQTRDVLLTTLRERQPQLHAHLEDVAALCLAVGRKLGMSAEELDETARAAELHDVGKVAIPDAILEKPGPLDEEEWQFMRRHTIIGERILGAAPALVPVARVVRSSHERFDGDGYPDGLAGEEIPLGARVVAVCDAYDAMTSKRPYRESLSSEEAVAELRRFAGTQFDPRAVEAFCAVLAETSSEPRAANARSLATDS